MLASWLEVPHFQQATEGACLAACARMVLAYLQSPIPENKINELLGTDEIGIPASRVLRLEKWGFQVTYGTADLQMLRDWLNQGVPPIAFVQTQFLDYWTENTSHAVVVVGINDEHIYLNDPAFAIAPQIVSPDGFLAACIEMDEVAAIVTRRD